MALSILGRHGRFFFSFFPTRVYDFPSMRFFCVERVGFNLFSEMRRRDNAGISVSMNILWVFWDSEGMG